MSKKKEFPLNIGMSSVLLIFVVLCLVSFSILSITSANADRKLSQKVLNRSIAYYDACNQAEDMLADTDAQLHTLYDSCDSIQTYLSQVSTINKEYHYTISDLQELRVTLEYPYPASKDTPFYHIVSWQVINLQNHEYDEHLHVIE